MSEQITSVRIEIKTDSDEHVIVRLIDARVMSAAEVRAKAVAFLDESCGALSEPSELTALARDVAAIRKLLSATYGVTYTGTVDPERAARLASRP